jgi:hypothetical protein
MGHGVVSETITLLKGLFEVRTHPIANPDRVQLRYGRADQALGGWYVVIDNGSRIDAPTVWGYGLSWYHPDPNFQYQLHGTFDQKLTPMDDAARAIVKRVKEQR